MINKIKQIIEPKKENDLVLAGTNIFSGNIQLKVNKANDDTYLALLIKKVEDIEKMYADIVQIRNIGTVKNVFSHLVWHIDAYEVVVNHKPELDGIWVSEEEMLELYPVPTVMDKVWKLTK